MNLRPIESMPESYYVRYEELHRRARRRSAPASAHVALSDHEGLTRGEWLTRWAAELRRPPGKRRWIITARNSCGQEYFLSVSPTQGTSMIPGGHSLAKRFHNRTEAEAERREAIVRFRGLADWELSQEGGAR